MCLCLREGRLYYQPHSFQFGIPSFSQAPRELVVDNLDQPSDLFIPMEGTIVNMARKMEMRRPSKPMQLSRVEGFSKTKRALKSMASLSTLLSLDFAYTVKTTLWIRGLGDGC
jgi:hypothetical protein